MTAKIVRITKATLDSTLRMAAHLLAEGKLIVLPTDTVYGVAAHPNRPDAIHKLYDAKCRDQGKPIPLLAAGRDEAERCGALFTPALRRLADRYWPGALTLVLPVGETTEGIRVPDLDATRQLLRQSGGMLRVTSANQSGAPPALTAAEAATALGDWVELILDAGDAPGGIASSVVVADEVSDIRVLREGAIPTAELKDVARG